MRSNTWIMTGLLFCLLGAAQAGNMPGPEDDANIRALLDNYTQSVSSGDRARFESQLLDLAIPFYGVGAGGLQGAGLRAIQDYRGFRAAIFDSGTRFRQRFSNVSIEQLGNLAQVSLDYETARQGEAYEGKGWKIIQLIRVDGQWKIASELFTGYPSK